MGQVDGKVAIVTGGASGIGAACAATLAREGAKVVVTDLDDAGGRDLVDKISGAGGEAIFLHQDVSLEESWPSMIEATERRFGHLDGDGRQRRHWDPMQSRRDVVGRLAATNRGEPRRRVSVGEIHRTCNAACRRWIHHHYVVVAGLRGSAGLAGYCATREAYACSLRRSRWSARQKAMGYGSTPSIPGSSTRRFGRSYRYRPGAMADRSERSGQSRSTVPQSRAGAGYRERSAVPRL